MASRFAKFLKRAAKKTGRGIKRYKKPLAVATGLTALTLIGSGVSRSAHRAAAEKSRPIRKKITTAKYNKLIDQGYTPEQIEKEIGLSSSPAAKLAPGRITLWEYWNS